MGPNFARAAYGGAKQTKNLLRNTFIALLFVGQTRCRAVLAEPVEAMHSGIKSEEKASVRPVLQSFSFQEARVRRADTLFTPGPNVKPLVVQSSYCCSVVTVSRNNKNSVQAPTFATTFLERLERLGIPRSRGSHG